VDFVRRWSEKTEIGAGRFIRWLDITASKFYGWRERYGKVNEHNGWVSRDFWLEGWEKQAIIAFHLKNSLEGYRRLTFMMLDADIVAAAEIATATNNDSSSTDKGRIIVFSSHASFRPKKENGHADAVLDSAGCGA
jgi:hypothetical protein